VTDSVSGTPRPALRWAFSIALGIACATYAYAVGWANPEFVSDFDQVWAGAKALWEQKDPYAVVGPNKEFHWKWPLYYPLPALVLVAPLGLMPVLFARAVFAGLSAALLAWAVTRDGWQRLPIFISVSFLVTVELGQWSALYAAAFFLPLLSVVGVAKPNIGVAVAAGASRVSTWLALAVGAVVLLGISTAIQPQWFTPWLQNLREAPHFQAAVTRPLGFLMLLALLRWRRPEARWLLAVSLVPVAPSFYDQMLLAVVCITSRESLVFAASTVVLFFYVGFNTPQPDYAAWGKLVGDGTLWICYFPALIMVLRRPNDGQVPGMNWLESVTQRFRSRQASVGAPSATQ
jgi:hypothetical protein